jgi:tetratricopeptide (TPR) repeat protein
MSFHQSHGIIGPQARIEEAGLLMAGDETMAQRFSDRAMELRTYTFAPEAVARLGWWYYRAGKYDTADKLLRRFLAMRLGDPGLQTAMGWGAFENDSPAEAVRLFRAAAEDDAPWRAAGAGNSVAEWRLRQTDAAMIWFEQSGRTGSSWNNPVWVKAFFGPQIVQSLQELRAEDDRRIAARRR